ncbi:hypothetical protein DERF_005985 [Dermatophagoides farinae]|uniref:Uncharacterized protein n=1 Tax=Dermatophagoides farinae TaxID=6954 RepID=A0A922I813_DERFA|nr:hypothetical protein DERF_005985 [Dermatophagoides farinae]
MKKKNFLRNYPWLWLVVYNSHVYVVANDIPKKIQRLRRNYWRKIKNLQVTKITEMKMESCEDDDDDDDDDDNASNLSLLCLDASLPSIYFYLKIPFSSSYQSHQRSTIPFFSYF